MMTPDPRDGDPLRAPDAEPLAGVWTVAGTGNLNSEQIAAVRPKLEAAWEAGIHYVEDGLHTWRFEPFQSARTLHPLPVVARQGCGWWLLWLAVGAAFWAIVVALVLANRAAPRPESQPVEAPVPPSQQVAPATVGALSGAPLVPLATVAPAVVLATPPARVEFDPRSGAPLRGFATWCGPTPTQCQSWGGDAMLGAVPSFRFGDEPYRVTVSREGREPVTVLVVSFCACGDRHGIDTVIDLSPRAFEQLAPLSRGVVRVEVAPFSWKGME